jgi:diacylglycerol kinase (ATP)
VTHVVSVATSRGDPSTSPDAGRVERGRPSRVFLIARRRKGRPVAQVVREVRRLLDQEGITAKAKVVKRKREVRRAASRAVKARYDLVIGVGGDGTILQVVTSLAGTEVPLGIVPTGTGNLLAGNLGIPDPVRKAVRTALGGQPRRIDVGRLTIGGKQRDFTVACGVGFDADVMDRTDSQQKGRWGKIAYLASAILETGNIRNAPHDITLDGVGTRTDAAQILVANLGRVPPGIALPGVRQDDGLLDVFVINASGPISALMAGWEAVRQTELGESDGGRVFRAQAREVEIDTTPNRRVEVDGSVVGTTPIKITVRPAALTVMGPAR